MVKEQVLELLIRDDVVIPLDMHLNYQVTPAVHAHSNIVFVWLA
jgi:hypothetical protein